VPERSIFSGVARTENSHTELLCNLLHYSENFRALFHNFLTGVAIPSDPPHITTQFVSPEDGRPDLVFDYKNAAMRNLIIEVKVRTSRATTPYQAAEAEASGYHKLGRVFFLVPRGWDHVVIANARVLTWENLANQLSRSPEITQDTILREYLRHLDLEFPSIRFTEDEKVMLSLSRPHQVVETAIKLHRTVDSLAERFKEAGYRVESSGDASEYGYYIRSKTSSGMLLWFGMWSTYDLLLGAGYENAWHHSRQFEGFTQMANSRWSVLSLNEVIMRDDDDLVGVVFDQLATIVKSMAVV
jgi:hypothetical protein